MAEAKSPSTRDLLLLLTGFYTPKTPPTQSGSGEVYWLKEGTTNEDRELRDSKFNDRWLSSPMAAWDGVRFRDWLIATLFKNIAKKHDFVAISEPLIASIDVLGKEFTHDMKGVTDSILAALKTKEGRPRSLFNTLSIGISRHELGNKEVFMLGAGIRRRARFWRTESLAIQADVEFFVPFYEIPNSEPTPQPYHAYSINGGIALSHSDGSPLGTDEESKKELIAVRFNFRAPFTIKCLAAAFGPIEEKYRRHGLTEMTVAGPGESFPLPGRQVQFDVELSYNEANPAPITLRFQLVRNMKSRPDVDYLLDDFLRPASVGRHLVHQTNFDCEQ